MSSPGVSVTIPTIGKTMLNSIVVAGALAQRPVADGTHGLYYTVDEGKLYLDLGLGTPKTTGYAAQWVQIFSGGPTGT